MNVLSLFDGMSCGHLALDRASVPVDNYFASEIDKYAIQITQKNYPNTTQLGDINNWKSWNLPKIDIIIGGSPCQGFSIAGKRLNFDDPRSRLFFVFTEVLKHYKPKWFLLENVKMKKEWRNIITEFLGVEPIEINSALLSAQHRKRLYWTNIPNITQPKDKNITLSDVLEENVDKSFYVSDTWIKWIENKPSELQKKFVQISSVDKAITLTARMYASWRGNFVPIYTKVRSNVTRQKGNYLPRERVFNIYGKSRPISTSLSQHPYYEQEHQIRRLTPIECERLQTVPYNYTEGVSDTQRYKMLGNGWTVDVIAHIFSFIPN